MKINWNSKYNTIAVYSLIVTCGSIMFYFIAKLLKSNRKQKSIQLILQHLEQSQIKGTILLSFSLAIFVKNGFFSTTVNWLPAISTKTSPTLTLK